MLSFKRSASIQFTVNFWHFFKKIVVFLLTFDLPKRQKIKQRDWVLGC